jgi:hypothetical protein
LDQVCLETIGLKAGITEQSLSPSEEVSPRKIDVAPQGTRRATRAASIVSDAVPSRARKGRTPKQKLDSSRAEHLIFVWVLYFFLYNGAQEHGIQQSEVIS